MICNLLTKLHLSCGLIFLYTASELLVNREQKRRSKYNTESELDTDQSELDITGIINNNKSEDSEESQLEMANIYLRTSEEKPAVVEKLRKNSSEHLLPGKLPGFVVKYIELALLLHMMCTLFLLLVRDCNDFVVSTFPISSSRLLSSHMSFLTHTICNDYTPVTSSSATLTSSNITNIINENKLHSQRKQQQQNPNIWNNIRGSFKLNNNTSTSSSSGLGGIGGGGDRAGRWRGGVDVDGGLGAVVVDPMDADDDVMVGSSECY